MKSRSVYVMNRLKDIAKSCEKLPIEFKFCNGLENPADLMTRETSYRILAKSRFHTGPEFLEKEGPSLDTKFSILIPNPLFSRDAHQNEAPILKNAEATVDDREMFSGITTNQLDVEERPLPSINEQTSHSYFRKRKVDSQFQLSAVGCDISETNSPLIDSSSFSSIMKMVRVMSLCFKFIDKLKVKAKITNSENPNF